MSGRDRDYERDMLKRGEQQAGLMGLGFPDLVLERLDTVGGAYGDRWLGMAPLELVREIREEGVDLAGWSALLSQRLLLDRTGDTLEARMTLQAIIAEGAKVENLVRQLAEQLRRE